MDFIAEYWFVIAVVYFAIGAITVTLAVKSLVQENVEGGWYIAFVAGAAFLFGGVVFVVQLPGNLIATLGYVVHWAGDRYADGYHSYRR